MARVLSPSKKADFGEGDATKHFSVTNRFFSGKEGGNSVNEGFGKDILQEREFSEEARAIQWTAGLWKLKSCCPHPLPENRLLSNNSTVSPSHWDLQGGIESFW